MNIAKNSEIKLVYVNLCEIVIKILLYYFIPLILATLILYKLFMCGRYIHVDT